MPIYMPSLLCQISGTLGLAWIEPVRWGLAQATQEVLGELAYLGHSWWQPALTSTEQGRSGSYCRSSNGGPLSSYMAKMVPLSQPSVSFQGLQGLAAGCRG